MQISPEQLIEELCELVAKEKNYTQLQRLISRLIECLEARQKKRDREAGDPPEQPST